MSQAHKTRILFIEDSQGLSGSTVSLCNLLAGLDDAKYEGHVVFSRLDQQEYWRVSVRGPARTTVIGRRTGLKGTRWIGALARLARAIHPRAERLVRVPAALLDIIFVTLPYAARLAWFSRGKHIDLVHQNNGFYVAVVVLGWMMRVPVVAYQRGPEWNSPAVRYLAKRITFYCANSEATRQDLLKIGVPPERIEVVYPPVEFARFDAAVSADCVRREFGLAASELSFGIVGNLLEWKGQRVFLRAARQVLDAVPQARAFVIGGAQSGSEAYERELRALARDLRIDDRVVFTGFRRDVPELLKMLDVVVHASVRPEPFGRVIVEAMAMGKPVVAARAGGPLEIICSGENGFLVPPGDHEALAETLVRLLRDQNLARRVGARALLDAENRFSVVPHVGRMQEIYSRVLRGQTANRPLVAPQ